LVRQEADREDLAQDVFIQVIEHADRQSEPGKWKGWVGTIARNHAMNLRRRHLGLGLIPTDPGELSPAAPADDEVEACDNSAASLAAAIDQPSRGRRLTALGFLLMPHSRPKQRAEFLRVPFRNHRVHAQRLRKAFERLDLRDPFSDKNHPVGRMRPSLLETVTRIDQHLTTGDSLTGLYDVKPPLRHFAEAAGDCKTAPTSVGLYCMTAQAVAYHHLDAKKHSHATRCAASLLSLAASRSLATSGPQIELCDRMEEWGMQWGLTRVRRTEPQAAAHYIEAWKFIRDAEPFDPLSKAVLRSARRIALEGAISVLVRHPPDDQTARAYLDAFEASADEVADAVAAEARRRKEDVECLRELFRERARQSDPAAEAAGLG
ncbi:MAG TPA: sigma-70 family RNA polymerase sigma factor, partial [Urbifossiella sp.]|nr:sigma-70 family RNA polymerase sigma factor [Urbifossiella sp.]